MPKEKPDEGGAKTPEPGSPEDVAARLAALESQPGGDPPDGDPDGSSDSKPKPGDGKPSEPEVVELGKTEHDALHGELRLLRKEKRDRETAEADAKRDADRKKAEEAGDYDTAIDLERREKLAAQQKTQRMGLKLALSDAAEDRDWNATQRKLARKLIDPEALEFDDDGDPVEESLSKVLDALAEEYPETFTVPEPEPGDKDEPGGKKQPRTRKTPATTPQDGKPFDGYMTPEEFVGTSIEVRRTPEFQKRVEQSRPHWPDKVPHDSFPGGQGEG